MSKLPILTNSLQHINYYNNPIPSKKLPPLYQNVNCENSSQNCLPNELIKWKILNNTLKDSVNQIIKIKITFSSNYSLGNGNSLETIIFNQKKSKLVAKQTYLKRTKGSFSKNDKGKVIESTSNIQYSIKKSSLETILSDIYTEKLLIHPIIDSTIIINLKNKKNGTTCFSDCSDCNGYGLSYTIYTLTDTVNLKYGFEGSLDYGVSICSKNGPEDIKSILDWLHIYRLTNLTLQNHILVNRFFNRKNLDKIIKWDKEYEHTTKPIRNASFGEK